MAEVIWLRAALEDLDAIASYIGQDSERYAADFVQRIVDAAELLG